jgi:exodeoxyribonuclease V gamma subunit
LEAELAQKAPGRNFLSGGVTFCALVPMRTIPFEVVCLLGMNDGEFPRGRRPPAFDLIARRPQPGDRSMRDDDRYLFLEALLSARRKLIITYVGQSVHDNAEQAPSVVVHELLDTIEQSFKPDAGPPAGEIAAPRRQMDLFASSPEADAPESNQTVIRHPLQAFSPRYFRTARRRGLVSYSRRHYEASCALAAEKDHALRPFVGQALAVDEASLHEVTVDHLVRFFENPARAFLQSRLSLFLGDDVDVIEDREPIDLDNLDQWHVGDALLQAEVAGENVAHVGAGMIAAGSLPPGTLGQYALDDLGQCAAKIAAATLAIRQGDPLPPLEIDAQIDGVRLVGVQRNRWPAGYSQFQYSKLPSRRELAVWLRHLVIHLAEGETPGRHSFLVGRGKDGAVTIGFKPVANAGALLGRLIRLYLLGQTTPLPLFDKASRAYADCYLQVGRRRPATGDLHTRALADAAKAYEDDSERAFGDLRNEYVRQAFRDRDPVRNDETIPGAPADLPSKFSDLALAVYQPFFEHREEKKS